jgi:hypothetical protein
MLDGSYCAGLPLKAEPHVSCQALFALKQLWDEVLAPGKIPRQTPGKNITENAYAKNSNQTAPPRSVRKLEPVDLKGVFEGVRTRQNLGV